MMSVHNNVYASHKKLPLLKGFLWINPDANEANNKKRTKQTVCSKRSVPLQLGGPNVPLAARRT